MGIEPLQSFIFDDQFWWYHGWGLTTAWLLGSFIAIALRKRVPGKVGTYLHALTFLIVNSFTLFLAGGAFFRVYGNLDKFWDWALIKQAHIAAGIIFTLLIIFQHCGGLGLFLNGVGSKAHSSWGTFISIMMRMIVVFGWLLAKKENIAVGCFIVAFIESVILFKMPKATNRQKQDAGREKVFQERANLIEVDSRPPGNPKPPSADPSSKKGGKGNKKDKNH